MADYKQKREEREEIKEKERGKHFKLRNVLNIIFMVLAVIGVIIYLMVNDTIGIVVVLFAMVFKMAETVLRMVR